MRHRLIAGYVTLRYALAAGIVIVLDGLLTVRTDPDGRYRFDEVAQGPHRIEVIADALPLPWTIRPAEGQPTEAGRSGGILLGDVEIGLRETRRLDIPAQR